MTKFNITSEDYLNPAQLQEEFGLTINMQNKLRMRKNQGQTHSLPFIKIGKLILYNKYEIKAWLDRQLIGGIKCVE